MTFDLYKFNFCQFDTVRDVYAKYFKILPEYMPFAQAKKHTKIIMSVFDEPIGDLGDKMNEYHCLEGDEFKKKVLEVLDEF